VRAVLIEVNVAGVDLEAGLQAIRGVGANPQASAVIERCELREIAATA